jgi:hypothetical protein
LVFDLYFLFLFSREKKEKGLRVRVVRKILKGKTRKVTDKGNQPFLEFVLRKGIAETSLETSAEGVFPPIPDTPGSQLDPFDHEGQDFTFSFLDLLQKVGKLIVKPFILENISFTDLLQKVEELVVDPFVGKHFPFFLFRICYKRLKSWLWIPSLENIFLFSFFGSVAKCWKVDCETLFLEKISFTNLLQKVKKLVVDPFVGKHFSFSFFKSVAKGWKVDCGILLSKNLFPFSGL